MSEKMTRSTPTLSSLADQAEAIDHLAVAVADLEAAVAWYRDVMGFEVAERRTTHGKRTGMVSAVLKAGPITLVLVQGTSDASQVSRYVEHYGPGIQHIALKVRNLPEVVEQMTLAGMEFDTTIIQGTGIRQAFTHRDPLSGMMYELIERQSPDGHFTDESVQELFRQLEAKDSY